MSNIEDTMEMLREHTEWMDSLTEIDRTNFLILCSLPSAARVISEMPDNEYKKRCVFQLAVIEVTEGK